MNRKDRMYTIKGTHAHIPHTHTAFHSSPRITQTRAHTPENRMHRHHQSTGIWSILFIGARFYCCLTMFSDLSIKCRYFWVFFSKEFSPNIVVVVSFVRLQSLPFRMHGNMFSLQHSDINWFFVLFSSVIKTLTQTIL